jgi:hypothetical protein
MKPMIRSALKVLAYSKAPRTTFALRHPIEAIRLARMRRRLKAKAPKALAIGAGVAALPLTLALGRKIRRQW